jgi:hypothetical protein
LGVCGLVLLTGMTVTWLAYASARTSTELLVDRLFRERCFVFGLAGNMESPGIGPVTRNSFLKGPARHD